VTRRLPASPPATLVAYEIEPGKVLFVHSLPTGTIAGLTPSEEEVLALVLAGHDNASIAAVRKTASRTVANQLASIFRKAGASSRAELAVRVSAGDPDLSSK
jgi:DNA-binding CsgD family transcriptional regulator